MMIAYEHLGQKILHFWSVGDDCYMGDAPSQFLFTDSDPAFPGLRQALDEETFRTVIAVRNRSLVQIQEIWLLAFWNSSCQPTNPAPIQDRLARKEPKHS